MSESIDVILENLESGDKKNTIKTIESLSLTKNPYIIHKIISKLDDPDIEVRGEAFSCLVLNEKKISKLLIENINSESKNIRAFSSLILANRKDFDAIPEIIDLTKDSSSMVRACALGSLGFLKADEASDAIRNCFSDSKLEVKKSALKAAIDIGLKIRTKEFEKIKEFTDEELEKLIEIAMEKN